MDDKAEQLSMLIFIYLHNAFERSIYRPSISVMERFSVHGSRVASYTIARAGWCWMVLPLHWVTKAEFDLDRGVHA